MYAKLFSSLYQGTLRGQSNEILVFTNLLAHTGRDGVVDKHFRAIAEETGLTQEQVKASIERLEAPDAESRSPEESGARIVRIDEHRVWGWRVVNYAKYRAIRSEDDRAEQNRLSQQRWREKFKASVSNRKPASAESKQDKPMEKDREKEKDKKEESRSGYFVPACFEKIEGFTAKLADWIASRKLMKKPATGQAIQMLVNRLSERPHQAVAALNEAIERGWITVKWHWLKDTELSVNGELPLATPDELADQKRQQAESDAWAASNAAELRRKLEAAQ